ncbi:hypothetical protein V2T44_08625 [Serratia ficaria]|uniref:Uncharacterized protein n=1 Tax=Serratia ficaria TaxID=61651 RepID=A0A240BJW2_SERFI|nr:hypothetical protein [Serratia ficaria]MEE4483012.1 hypothetical protein [Serratia ficaria]REF45986.1 hypothetical protein C7332_4354 [Serratia ficaria]CAI0849997.1 Uncharacterised protein [Serratia ficaria]CAI1022976.1 Uncharacterised protein [Serratia ficaria]CAI1036047.1 Uncharacterised protein [Serratia ficaria]
MMLITRLYPLHHPADSPPEPPKHVGETVFDSSLHPAEAAQSTLLRPLGRHAAKPAWRMRLNALRRRLRG